jgi:hypothetical protein
VGPEAGSRRRERGREEESRGRGGRHGSRRTGGREAASEVDGRRYLLGSAVAGGAQREPVFPEGIRNPNKAIGIWEPVSEG